MCDLCSVKKKLKSYRVYIQFEKPMRNQEKPMRNQRNQ